MTGVEGNCLRRMVAAAMVAACMLSVFADRVRTTRGRLKVSTVAAESSRRGSTRPAEKGEVAFYGYEKAANANRETLFIKNLTDSTVVRVCFTIDYSDTSSRQIHRRAASVDVEIPSGEVRRIDIPSWDSQKSYYYVKGPRPRKSATPYDVAVTADSIACAAELH